MMLKQHESFECASFTDTLDKNLPIKIHNRNSKLFANLLQEEIEIFEKEPVTFHYHYLSMLSENFQFHPEISKEFETTATSHEPKSNRTFVAVIESRSHPIVGVIWHPEKVRYESNKVTNQDENTWHCSVKLFETFREICIKGIQRHQHKEYKNKYEIYTVTTSKLNRFGKVLILK